MSAHIYIFAPGAKMKPSTPSTKNLGEVNIQLAQQQVQLEYISEQTDELKIHVQQNSQEITQVKIELGALREATDRNTSEIKDLKHEVAGLKHEVAGGKHELADVKHDVAGLMGLKQEVTEMRGEIKEMRQEIKGIISWKERAMGGLIVVSCLCTTGVTIFMAFRSAL